MRPPIRTLFNWLFLYIFYSIFLKPQNNDWPITSIKDVNLFFKLKCVQIIRGKPLARSSQIWTENECTLQTNKHSITVYILKDTKNNVW